MRSAPTRKRGCFEGVCRGPRSVGIIPDGNRRWALARGASLRAAYLRGALVALRIVQFLLGIDGIRSIVFYALSRDNCTRRSKLEVEAVYESLNLALEAYEASGMPSKARIIVVGDVDLLPQEGRRLVEDKVWDGEEVGGRFVAVAICYSLEWELERWGCPPATLKLGDIDLVFRSGGERRLSGFFPHLTTYSELYFTDKLWPDVTVGDVAAALRWYAKRDRRRGA